MQTKLQNPLAGLVFCSKCGHNLIKHPYKHAEDRLYCRYNKPACMKSAKLSDVIQAVILSLEESELPDLQAKLVNGEGSSAAIQKKILDKLEAQMAEYRQQEERQYDLLETGKYTQELFDRRNAALRQKIESCHKQICDAKMNMPKDVDYAERIVSLKEAIAALKDNTMPCEKQNQMLRKIIERIDVTTYEISPRKVGVNLKIKLLF